MNTGNTIYLDKKANREYYRKSDSNFMPLEQSMNSHKVLDRLAWARDWVHALGGGKPHMSIGCKDGYFCLTLAAEGIECVGVDPSEDAIDEAKLKASEADLKVTYLVGFAEEIPEGIRAGTVDCLDVIEHVVDPDKLLQVLCRVGMWIMISTPDAGGRHGLEDAKRNPEHLRVYTQKELEKLISKYGVIRESVIRDDQLLILFRPKQ